MKAWNTFAKYARIVWNVGIPMLYWHGFFVNRYAKHPEKYAFEKRYKYMRKISTRIIKRLRLEMRYEHPELIEHVKEPCLIVMNHQSVVDILSLMAFSENPVIYIGKKELEHTPFFGMDFKALDGLFLDRDDPRQAVRIIQSATKTLTETPYSVAIFPEGTRNHEPFAKDVGDFHGGSLKPAYRAKCGILQITTFGTFRGLGKGYNDRSALVQFDFVYHPYESFADLSTQDLAQKLQEYAGQKVREFREIDKDYHEKKLHKKLRRRWWKEQTPFNFVK